MDTAYSESETTYTFSQAAAQSQSRDLYRLLCVGHIPASAVRDVDLGGVMDEYFVRSFFFC